MLTLSLAPNALAASRGRPRDERVDPHVCEAHMVGPMYIRSRPSALVGSPERPRILKPSRALDPVVLTSLLVDHVTVQRLPFR